MDNATLMTFIAHPDDEAYSIGGTLLRYAREGVQIHIVVATDGAAGSVDPTFDCEGLGLADIRRKEMQASAAIIGAKLHWLNYRDSGMHGDPSNQDPLAFINADKKNIINQVRELITLIRPQVVLTHDENGGYFHPDHIRCHEVVTAAVQDILNQDAAGVQPMLYYHVLPKWWVLVYAFGMFLGGNDPRKWGRGKDIDVTKAGTPSYKIDTKINVATDWELKRSICAQHRSQGGDNYVYFNRSIPVWLQKAIFGVEFFVRAYPIRTRKKVVRDLFEN